MERFLALAAAAVFWAASPQAAGVQNLRLPMDDGVEVAVSLFVPEGDAPVAGWPAIIAFHGLGGNRGSWDALAEEYFVSHGYVVLTVDARGHGESGGQNDIDGPRTVADVRALFGWLAARPDVADDRIGAVGTSLGGGAIWRSAVEGVPFAALVPITSWTDLYSALLPGNLAKSGAVLNFLSSLPPERFAPLVNELRTDLLRSSNLDRLREIARERSSRHLLERIRVPVFLIQGRRDFAFDIGQAVSAYRAIPGQQVPKRLYIGDLGHAPATNPPAERPHYLTEVRQWFDRWLNGEENGIDTRPRVELAHDPWSGRTKSYNALPATKPIRLAFGGRATLRPSGKIVRTLRLPRRVLETFGAPTVRMSASSRTGWPSLVAVVSALTPDGSELVVAAGGAKTGRVTRKPRNVTVRLTDQATVIPRGSRLRLTLATSSTAQNAANLLYLPFAYPETLKLSVDRVRLTLPVLRRPVSG